MECDLAEIEYDSLANIECHTSIYKKERDAVKETRKVDECDMEKLGILDSIEKTIVILGDR